MSGWFLRTVQMFVVSSAIFMGYRTAAQFDGELFPVIDNVALIDARPGPNNSDTNATTYTRMSWHKARECTHKKTEWYVGKPSRSIIVTSEVLNSQDRPTLKGEVGSTERLIRMSELNLRRNSYALVYHDCYDGWLWDTVTLYWDSSRDQPQVEDYTN